MEPDNSPKCSHEQNSGTELNIENTSERLQNTSLQDATRDINPVSPQSIQLQPNPNLIKSIDTMNSSKPTSTLMTPRSMVSNQPQSLFVQALSQLDETTFNYKAFNPLKIFTVISQNNRNKIVNAGLNSGEISPPDSLTSAPPSYLFVLRQMTARRPRLMGTFIPSPSFVQHTPPPNYATAFDIYVDNSIPPPPPPRVYNFSFASMPVLCPECGYMGMTTIISKITMCTHLCAFILCILFCWICVPLPYVLRSCKNVYHYCRNCRNFLGMYCPTSPDNSYR